MTEGEFAGLVEQLTGVRVLLASAANGAPESAWGDSFFYYDPESTEDQRLPFATIVTHDTPGWDEASHLDRPGAFRVNLAVGRDRVPDAGSDIDYSKIDVLLPHPQYAAQGWVSVVNPGALTDQLVIESVEVAHQRARSRHRPAGSGSSR